MWVSALTRQFKQVISLKLSKEARPGKVQLDGCR